MIRLAFLRSFLAAALLVAVPAPLLAVTPPVDSNVGAIVLKPLSLLNTQDLDFGTLYPSASAGTATVDPFTGAVTTAGGVTFATGVTTAANFMGVGTRNMPIHIKLPKDPAILTRSGGTETMTVSNWTTDGNTTRQINAFEVFQFKVGGRLNVGANQADGIYTGTFEVTVVYQ